MNRFVSKGLALVACAAVLSGLLPAALGDQIPAGVFLDGQGNGLPYLDGSTATSGAIAPGFELHISSKTPVAGLYLRWNVHPGPYDVSWEGGSQRAGENEFLHEYLPLDKPVMELVLSGWAGEGRLCDVALLDAGPLPGWVQDWRPPCERADLLLLPTHADDELLFFGGAMPYYAGELGYAVQVAYMTNHSTEPYREHERLNGLWTAGVRHYPIVGPFPDLYSETLEQAGTQYDIQAVEAWQVGLLRRFRPQVVVGHDLGGEYGHGGHMLNAQALTQALDAAARAGAFPESEEAHGLWDTPKAYLHLYEDNPIVMDWSRPLEAFGGRTAYQVAVEAFACHASQQSFQMGGSGVFDNTRFGLYRTRVGPDTGEGDFFENIQRTSTPLPDPQPDGPSQESSQPQPTVEPDPTPERPTLEQFLGKWGMWLVLGALALVVLGAVILMRSFPRSRR